MRNRYALQPNMMREYHGGRQEECGHYRLSKRTPSAYESWSNTGVLDVTSRPGWIGQGSAYRIITPYTTRIAIDSALECRVVRVMTSVSNLLWHTFLLCSSGTGKACMTHVQVKFGTQFLEAPEQSHVVHTERPHPSLLGGYL